MNEPVSSQRQEPSPPLTTASQINTPGEPPAAQASTTPSVRAAPVLTITMLGTLLATAAFAWIGDIGVTPVLTAALLWILLVSIIVPGLLQQARTQPEFGFANTVTTARAGMTVLLAAFIPTAIALSDAMLWTFTIIAALALALDGIDGYLARIHDESSSFGARYDMEIDALMALVISLLLWRSGEAGIWILGLGVLRYVFIAASVLLPALRAPLFPSLRRKLICVVQIAALCAMLSPVITGTQSTLIGVVALALLAGSFARDTHWLLLHR